MDDAKAAYRRAIRAVADGDTSRLAASVANDVIDHNPIPGQTPGIGGIVEFMHALHTGLGGLSLDVQHVISEGSFAAARIVWSGIHQEQLAGIPPSGRHVSIPALHLVRVDDGRITEWWGHADVSDLNAG